MQIEATDNAVFDISLAIAHLEKGEQVTVTRAGVPIAQLIAVNHAESRRQEISDIVARIRQFRQQHTLEGISIKELINEGRRF